MTYLLPTLLIKAAVAAVAVLAVRAKAEWFRVLGFILAEAVMVAGYFVVEWLFLGYGFAAASASVLGNTMQGLSGVVIGLLLILYGLPTTIIVKLLFFFSFLLVRLKAMHSPYASRRRDTTPIHLDTPLT